MEEREGWGGGGGSQHKQMWLNACLATNDFTEFKPRTCGIRVQCSKCSGCHHYYYFLVYNLLLLQKLNNGSILFIFIKKLL